ncbi:hypothetical protein M426DRAFT_259054 [Hypoxylon sp. CI-4A]|nr:hypothetical protein M426DRAFT_259054 [Hypoxylon sp. CI-4A]
MGNVSLDQTGKDYLPARLGPLDLDALPYDGEDIDEPALKDSGDFGEYSQWVLARVRRIRGSNSMARLLDDRKLTAKWVMSLNTYHRNQILHYRKLSLGTSSPCNHEGKVQLILFSESEYFNTYYQLPTHKCVALSCLQRIVAPIVRQETVPLDTVSSCPAIFMVLVLVAIIMVLVAGALIGPINGVSTTVSASYSAPNAVHQTQASLPISYSAPNPIRQIQTPLPASYPAPNPIHQTQGSLPTSYSAPHPIQHHILFSTTSYSAPHPIQHHILFSTTSYSAPHPIHQIQTSLPASYSAPNPFRTQASLPAPTQPREPAMRPATEPSRRPLPTPDRRAHERSVTYIATPLARIRADLNRIANELERIERDPGLYLA